MKGQLFRAGDWVRGYRVQDVQNEKLRGESALGELSSVCPDGTIEIITSASSSGPYICSHYWPVPKQWLAPKRVRRIKIFYAYDEKDKNLADALRRHLHFLNKEAVWDYYSNVKAGEEELKEINNHLDSANIILLLISANFISSKYYTYIEKRAMEKHGRGEGRIVPIILRPVILEGTPFADLQQLPANKKPITTWLNRDAGYMDVGMGILQVIRELKGEEPRKPDYLYFYQMGLEALNERKHYQEALDAFERAINDNPTYSDAYYMRGIALSRLGRKPEALRAFQKAIDLDQQMAVAYFSKAVLLHQLGELLEARIAYNAAVEIDPGIQLGYIEYANALEVSENFIEEMQTPGTDVSTVPSATPEPSPSEDTDRERMPDADAHTTFLATSGPVLPSPGDKNAARTPDADVSSIPPATPERVPVLSTALPPVPVMPKTTPATPYSSPSPATVTGSARNLRTKPPERTPYQLSSQNSFPPIARSRSRWKRAIVSVLVLFVIIAGSVIIYLRVATPGTKTPVGPYAIPFSDIIASFYANPRDSGTFDLAPSTPLDASPQSFSTITFNPDLQKEHCTAITIDTKIRQFRDITKKADGSCTVTIAHDSRGHQLGNGDRSSFEAVFIAFITVKSAGSLIISIDSDDGWILAIGKSGKYQPQADRNNIMQHPLTKKKLSAIKQYPEMGDYNIPSSSTHMIKVSFPVAGTYPVEIDYTECCGGPLVLVVTDEFTPSQS